MFIIISEDVYLHRCVLCAFSIHWLILAVLVSLTFPRCLELQISMNRFEVPKGQQINTSEYVNEKGEAMRYARNGKISYPHSHRSVCVLCVCVDICAYLYLSVHCHFLSRNRNLLTSLCAVKTLLTGNHNHISFSCKKKKSEQVEDRLRQMCPVLEKGGNCAATKAESPYYRKNKVVYIWLQ